MKGNIGLVFTKMKERGINTPEKAVDRKAIAVLTGLGEQQVSTVVHSLSKQKYFGRNKVVQQDGTWRYNYWVMREPNGKKQRRRRAVTRVAAFTRAAADYKISITGPDLLLEQTVKGGTVREVLNQLIK